jgi:hypothetical protein
MECYDGAPYDPADPNMTKSGKYGAYVQTCPNSTCNCNCRGACECPSQCVGPTCDKKGMPMTDCEPGPNGTTITYCQTTCATNPDGTKINGNCGTDSKPASTCPFGQGNNGTPKPDPGGGINNETCYTCKNDPGTGGNTNDYQCACACGVDNCGTACGQGFDGEVPFRECLTFCPTLNCDED